MTVCNDCGDTLVEVWHDVYVCPDCFFAALTVRHRGTGRESGGHAGADKATEAASVAAAKFLCPSCHAIKPWPFPHHSYPLDEHGLVREPSPRGIVCSSCYTYAQEHAERADAREDEMEGYVDRR